MKKREFLKAGFIGLGAMIIPKKAFSLEYYPKASDKRWAVLYGTWCGTARDAGVWISEGMDGIANVFDVRENPDLSAYEHVIVGGAIRGGITPQELQDFLAKNKNMLSGKIRGFYAVCGNMMQPVTQKQTDDFITNHLSEITGVTDVPSKVFLGRITWGLMTPEVREQMQSMPNMKEYDNLKRDECMAFGKKVLGTVLS